jgi:hypothetical protein
MGAGESISYMPKWIVAIGDWFAHCRKLSNRWWAVITIVWSAFTIADFVINRAGSDSQKAAWKYATLQFPFGWQAWLIGLLLIVLILVYDASYRHAKRMAFKIMELSWPDNRPQILFDSWGEIPESHPERKFAERSTPAGIEREYYHFQRGLYLSNHGGTAHEITCFPVELADNVYALGITVPRIDKDGQGFMLVQMDIEHNARFMEEDERWDLLKVMVILEKKINASRVGETSIQVEIGVCYRDAREVWYASFCRVTYRKDLKRLSFGPTSQTKTGFLDKSVLQRYLTRD